MSIEEWNGAQSTTFESKRPSYGLGYVTRTQGAKQFPGATAVRYRHPLRNRLAHQCYDFAPSPALHPDPDR